MKKLDKYLLRSFFGPFILTFSVVLFILIMQFLWLYIDELVGKGLSAGVIAEFLGWGSITIIPMALPLATLLASIMTMGGLGEHNELLSMKTAGISLRRILMPLIFVSFFICAGAFYVSNNLIPIAYQRIYALRDDIGKTKEEIKIPTGTFYDGLEGYMIRVDRNNPKTGMMYDLMIYDHTDNLGNTNLILADSGLFRISDDKGRMLIQLYHGRNYSEQNTLTFRDTVLDQSIISFDYQELTLSLEDYAFSRSDEGDRFGNEIMAKNLKTLRHDSDSIKELWADARLQLFRRYIYGCDHLFMSQLDTSIQKTKLGEFDLSLIEEDDNVREISSVRNAISRVDRAIEAAENYERESYRYASPIRKMDIESYRKFTLALACLIFFFIGAPLGAIIRKGGLGTPVIISVLFFVLYWVVDMSAKKLARDGAISPFIGAVASSLVLLPIGIFLTWKSTKDSAMFNLDSYKLFFQRIWSGAGKATRKLLHGNRKTGIVYMGTPDFAVEPLKALLETDYEVRAVVTVPDKQSGRGLKVNESAVKKFAAEKGIPILQPVSLKDPEFLAQLAAYKADLFVVVAFRMLPKEVWSMPKLGTFNLHASLLPQYRGAAPINWAIINGERQTGVTTFLIDEKIDTGRILFSEVCPIENYDNVGSLHDKLAEIGSKLVVKTAEALVRKRVKPRVQEVYTELKPAPKISRETCAIDWSRPATEVNNLIRGLSPYPGAHATLRCEGVDTDVKIYSAYVFNGEEDDRSIGELFTDGKSFLSVACGENSIRIEEIQLAGKKRMEIKSFLAGFREPEKYRFV